MFVAPALTHVAVPPGMAETSPGLPGYDRYDFPVDRGTIRGNLAAFGFDRLRRWDEPFNYGDDFPDIGELVVPLQDILPALLWALTHAVTCH